MNESAEPSLSLSGRVVVTVHAASAAASSSRSGLEIDRGQTPQLGDVRLDVTLDPEARSASFVQRDAERGEGEPLRGWLVAVVFDGLCWQRFDLTSVTANIRFATPLQLGGVLRWVCTAVRTSAGRPLLRREAVQDAPAALIAAPRGSSLHREPGVVHPCAPASQIEASPGKHAIRRLTYCSVRTPGLTDERLLRELIAPAMLRNQRDGVTGCLWCGQRTFVQVLEGPPDVIESLLTRLRRDPRHSDLKVLSDLPARMRLFQNWHLKWVRQGVCREVETFTEKLVKTSKAEAAATQPAGQRGTATSGESGLVTEVLTQLLCAEETIY